MAATQALQKSLMNIIPISPKVSFQDQPKKPAQFSSWNDDSIESYM